MSLIDCLKALVGDDSIPYDDHVKALYKYGDELDRAWKLKLHDESIKHDAEVAAFKERVDDLQAINKNMALNLTLLTDERDKAVLQVSKIRGIVQS